MTVTLTIKQVPEAVASRLKSRAKANRRSLQGELLCIVEAAATRDAAAISEPAAPRYSMLRNPARGASKRIARRPGQAKAGHSAAGDRDVRTLADRLRGRATARLSTDEIMRLTRGA